MKFAEEMEGIVMGKLLVTLLPADGITKAIYAGGHYVREHQQRRKSKKMNYHNDQKFYPKRAKIEKRCFACW